MGIGEREGSAEAFREEADEVEAEPHSAALFLGSEEWFSEVGGESVWQSRSLILHGEGDPFVLEGGAEADEAGGGFGGVTDEASNGLGHGGFWEEQCDGLDGVWADDAGEDVGCENVAERVEEVADGRLDGGFAEFGGGFCVEATEEGAAPFGF